MRPSIAFLVLSLILVPGRARAAPTSADDASYVLVPEDGGDAPVGPRPFAIGISGLGGAREDGRGGLVPTFSAGLDLALTLDPWVRIAIRRIGYGQARTIAGDRHAVSLSPALEVAIPVAEWMEPFAQVGVALQARFGDEQTMAAGLAPFVGVGLRLRPDDWISISFESALHMPATSSFLLGHEVLPQGALALQGGLGLAFHP